ncbi:hypothetical protein ACFWY6_45090, partial [Streptomyces sp. NPDC059037]
RVLRGDAPVQVGGHVPLRGPPGGGPPPPGEALSFPTPVTVVSRPRALRVRVPRHRPGVSRPRSRLDWRRLRDLALARG